MRKTIATLMATLLISCSALAGEAPLSSDTEHPKNCVDESAPLSRAPSGSSVVSDSEAPSAAVPETVKVQSPPQSGLGDRY
jgi:hypothetical protein